MIIWLLIIGMFISFWGVIAAYHDRSWRKDWWMFSILFGLYMLFAGVGILAMTGISP